MYSMFFRTSVMFILVMFSLRIMGKKNLGEFSPSDLVSTILISNITSMAIESPQMPLIFTISPILLITCYEVFVSVIIRKSSKLSQLAQGKPMVIVKKGVINQKVMNRLRFTVDDVLEAMRNKDIFYLEEVALAMVETTGAVNIYTDPSAQNHLKKAPFPPLAVIIDGQINKDNLQTGSISEKTVENILSKEKVSLKQVLLLLIDGNQSYNLTLKEEK